MSYDEDETLNDSNFDPNSDNFDDDETFDETFGENDDFRFGEEEPENI